MPTLSAKSALTFDLLVSFHDLHTCQTARIVSGWSFILTTDPEVIKLFSSSAQLSTKFQLLINVEMVKISGKFRFNTQKLVIYPANKC